MKLPDQPSAEMLRLRWQVTKHIAWMNIGYLILVILFFTIPAVSLRGDLWSVFGFLVFNSVVSACCMFFAVSTTSLFAIAGVALLLGFLELDLRAPAYGVILSGSLYAIWLLLWSALMQWGPPLTLNQLLLGPVSICVASHIGGLLGSCAYIKQFASPANDNQVVAKDSFQFGIRQLLLITVLAAVGCLVFKSIVLFQTPQFLQLLGMLVFVQVGMQIIGRSIRPVVVVAH